MDMPEQEVRHHRWSPVFVLGCTCVLLAALVGLIMWLSMVRGGWQYSFTDSGACRTDLWVRSVRAAPGECAYEIKFGVREKSGAAVTEANVIVFNDANRNGEFDASEETLLEYHMPPGRPRAVVQSGPLIARWQADEQPYPFLLTTYEVNQSERGRSLSALFNVATQTIPTSQPAASQAVPKAND